jgi:hypothetical protein
MKSRLSGSTAPAGGGRQPTQHDADRLSTRRTATPRQDAVFVKRGVKRTGPNEAVLGVMRGPRNVESPIFMGIYRHLLGPHEQRKSDSDPEGRCKVAFVVNYLPRKNS